MGIELPKCKSLTVNPSQDELREWVAHMPNARETQFGNYNVKARVTARSPESQFVVTDDPSTTQKQAMPRAEYDELARRQDEYIAGQDMIAIEGYIGPENSPMRAPARIFIEKTNANIPGMQAHLYYPKDADWREEDAFTVIYTPNLEAPGYPDDRVIAIDLDNWVTRVCNADYFGESKMGGLRMWGEWCYRRGALAMHAGIKVIPTDDGDKVGLIVGLSGTGKTTTTFTRQNNSLPVQDDFVALVMGGDVYSSENGCFAKTIALDPNAEPIIYGALSKPTAWLENVKVEESDGAVDFFDATHTANGRGTFPLAEIEHFDPRKLSKADFLLILNRNSSIVPAVAKMTSKEQAVAYFMLGETTGTSAGGVSEAGKAMRVPGTNPFFLQFDYMQGNRLAEIIDSMDYDFQVYVLNTGSIGGKEGEEGAKKVKIAHSSAIVKAIAEDSIRWSQDPEFGYFIAEEVPGMDDPELLEPRRLYEAQGRSDEYDQIVGRFKDERVQYMKGHAGLDDSVVDALK